MTRVSERDVKAAFDLVYDAASYNGDDPFPIEFLRGLGALIPSDAIVGFHEVVVGHPCRTVESVEIPEEGIPEPIQQLGKQWGAQDPIRHSIGVRSARAMKLSDFLTRSAMRKLDFYWNVWRPLGIDDSLRLWIPAPAGRARMFYLERGKRDFSERDRTLLELLRPCLIKIHSAAMTRRRIAAPQVPTLTPREREILTWIARGKTSREIAELLFVSPHTVRKHTEHILEKLDVRTRSAAVATAFPSP